VLLGEAIGLDLVLSATEKNVGPFRADILCQDSASDSWVLIENQLERMDHMHLGQLITYAAGLSAVTIVWIASRFTEEHRLRTQVQRHMQAQRLDAHSADHRQGRHE
jgi:hypothetical protein